LRPPKHSRIGENGLRWFGDNVWADPKIMPTAKLILFDCDSTLSALEGVDELARLRGPEVHQRVEAMTNDAMDGHLPVEAVFAGRLQIIQPRRVDLEEIGRRYIDTVEPEAIRVLQLLQQDGWVPVILSGGFSHAIRPLADYLKIARVEAVELYFEPDGTYRGFDTSYPTTRSGGKPEVVARLRSEYHPERIVMVGDGVSDLETKPVVDLFVGFGRYVRRARVVAEADHFIESLADLPALLSARAT